MSYVVVRMYAPAGDITTDALSKQAGQELAPRLFKVGCQRYTTVQFANGHIGSTSLYQDQESAERATQIAIEWVKGTGAVQGGLVRTLRGETVFSYYPSQDRPVLDNAFGVIRIYATKASAQDVKAALQQEATPILKDAAGLLTYRCFKTEDGFAVMTASTSREATSQLTARAREATAKGGSALQKVFNQPPEVIEGEILHSFSG